MFNFKGEMLMSTIFSANVQKITMHTYKIINVKKMLNISTMRNIIPSNRHIFV